MNPPKLEDYFKDAKNLITPEMAKTRRRIHNEIKQETIVEKALDDAKRREKEMIANTQQERDLAFELRKLKNQKTAEDKLRQQLRETSQELKALESQLRAAYVAKSLTYQISEKQLRKDIAKQEEKEENKLLEEARMKNEENEKLLQNVEKQKKIEFRQKLLEQMEIQNQRKMKKYEEFLREKKILDEVIRKLYEEQLQEMQDKISKKQHFREEMDKFLHAQKIWRERKQLEMEEENQRLLKYIREKEERMHHDLELKKLEEKAKTDISSQLGTRLKLLEQEKQQREQLLIELHAAEINEKEEAKIRAELEKQLRQRIHTRLQLDEQRQDIVHRRHREQEAEKLFREEQLRIMAERDKLDQMSDEKRRRKILEHRRAIQQCLDEKKQRKAHEIALLDKQREEDISEEKKRQQLIEDERIRILQEHATELIGFLPRGILRESDREFLALPPKDIPTK